MLQNEKIKNYLIEGIIGKGAYGSVYLCKDEKTKQHVVLKKIQVDNDPEAREKVIKEAKFLYELKHPAIISLYDSFFTDNGDFCLILEYANASDLKTFIEKHKIITEKKVIQIFTQLIMGLQFIHEKGVLHRDIKTANVFLFRNGLVKLGDFGVSRKIKEGELASTIIGTPYFMCPELIQGKPYSFPADIWAAGCVLFEMLAHQHAFTGRSREELFRNITNNNINDFPTEYSREMIDLLKWMLSIDPNQRPTCSEILETNIISKGLQALKNKLIKLQNTPNDDKQRTISGIPVRQNSSASKRRQTGTSESRLDTSIEEEIDQQQLPDWLQQNTEVRNELDKQSRKQLIDDQYGMLDFVRQSITKISIAKMKQQEPLTQLTANVQKRKENLIKEVKQHLGDKYDLVYNFIKQNGQENHNIIITQLNMGKDIEQDLKKLEIITAIEILS